MVWEVPRRFSISFSIAWRFSSVMGSVLLVPGLVQVVLGLLGGVTLRQVFLFLNDAPGHLCDGHVVALGQLERRALDCFDRAGRLLQLVAQVLVLLEGRD